MKKIDKRPWIWLLIGLVLTMLSYGRLNTGICAWLFAIPLLRYINIRTKWSSILFMLVGMIVAANITFFGLVSENPTIMNQLYCTLNGIRMCFPFLVYFLCRKLKARPIIAYYAFPAAVAVCEFFIDNPFISVMTSLSVSQFSNISLMQVASVTGVVGVSFIVTLFASTVNYLWEEGKSKGAVRQAAGYAAGLMLILMIGGYTVPKINAASKTLRVAAGFENVNLITDETLANYEGTEADRIYQLSVDVLRTRAKQAAESGSALLVFPEDAFTCTTSGRDAILEAAQGIAAENHIHILFPLLVRSEEPEGKAQNTLNFIDSSGTLVNTYMKNHLVPVVEEPRAERGDGKTPVVEIDGVKITYLICADYTSNQYAYNGREADIFLNPSYDWEAFQYFTSYGVQARAIECGFSVLRNPVNGNVILYDPYGRPIYMTNAQNVHTGMVYLDIPTQGRQTFYAATGNWFPWLCAVYVLFALTSKFYIRKKGER